MSKYDSSEPRDDAVRALQLRRMQRAASLLLAVIAVVYVFARMVEQRHPALGYLRAFCEAALVGGLADWFAVTALFRHPLRVPLPHTAIVPQNKDRIGRTLGDFVQRNFLSDEVVLTRLADIDFARIAARWLADPSRTDPLVAHVARGVPQVLDTVADEPARHFVKRNLSAALERIELAPLAANVLEILAASGQHQRLLDELLAQVRRLLESSEPEIRAKVREKTAWLWKKLGVDEAISDRIMRAAEEALAEIGADPQHAWRQRFAAMLDGYVVSLRESPEHRARAERLKQALLEHPALAEYLNQVWDRLRERLREDVRSPDSRVQAGLQDAVRAIGENLLADDAVSEAFNAWLRRVLADLVRQRRQAVAALIEDTVRRWDTGVFTRRIELAIGRDLQYIRVNGTLIGGAIGVLIHALSGFLPALG